VEICDEALSVTKSDFSRFDGHCSNVTRELERRAFLRAFHRSHHADILRLMRSQYGVKCYGQLGAVYESYFARLSGSPETSSFNGLDNAFVSYQALRITRPDGSSMSPDQAWKSLGLYGGDDGLTADLDPVSYKKSADWVGQKVTFEAVPRGRPGVSFLSRQYSPDVWWGDDNSCCDIKRQLSKFHSTVALNPKVTPVMKFLEKCRAFILTDEFTPIIGPLVSRAVQIHGGDIEADAALMPVAAWNSYLPKEMQYRNVAAEWMYDYLRVSLPGVDEARFNNWLSSTKTLADLLTPPLLLEPSAPKSSVQVVIEDQVLPHGCKPKPVPVPPTDVPFAKKFPNADKSKPAPPSVSSNAPSDFELMKARKQADGTWVEKAPDTKAKPKAARPKKEPLSKEAFEALKADLQAKGKWVDKTPRKKA
jgi:hypothetical protein